MSGRSPSQVFFDPTERRWRRFRRGVQAVSVALLLVLGVLIGTITVNPVLPNLPLSSLHTARRIQRLPPQQPKASTFGNKTDNSTRPSNRVARDGANTRLSGVPPVTPTNAPTGSGEIIGFYVNWDDNSFTSLKENLSRLDKLIPEFLHLTTADGTIVIDNPLRQAQVLAYVRDHRPTLRIVPLINNFNPQTNSWDHATLAKVLADRGARTRLIQNLLSFVTSNGLAGVSIDFEEIPLAGAHLRAFLGDLYARFHPLGLEVSQSVPLEDPSVDYRTLAQFTDYLILMAYDEHSSDSKAGPVASQSWYVDALRRRFTQLPPTTYVIALGSFGYDWIANTTSGTQLTFQDALRTAQESEGRITLDPRTLNPTFDYYDDNAKLHHVWFLDAVTAFNQLVEAQRDRPRGFGLWRLGSEDPSIWQVFARRTKLNSEVAETLRILHYSYDVAYEGDGEVLQVAKTPRDGTRAITYDAASSLVIGEMLLAYPSPYVITRRGGANTKKIALTFDDGPHPRYTRAVLDILRHYHVPATFFIIGANGVFHPELLQQIVSEGHEIGNHTFTHPNIATISREQLRLEINATERLLESTIGRRSLLFRPPYAEDIEPETSDQVKPLLFIRQLGYYTISMHVDPGDWLNPGVDQIVNATIVQAVRNAGRIVLLHDGGGDRSQTVAALPRIIEGLRARGFELDTVSSLLELTRQDVMPPISQDEHIIAGINVAGFRLINEFGSIMRDLFIAGLVLGLGRLLLLGVLAVAQKCRRQHFSASAAYFPRVSVIVPAFNEAKVIGKAIRALLRSGYPNFDIIVVDDGSSDDTFRQVVDSFGHNSRVRAYKQVNRGKAEALNYGITQTPAEIIVMLDADTMIRPDAIAKLVRHFSNPQIGGVAGNAKVGNRINLLTNWQALEYITSQNMDRRAFDVLNCICVVPGAIGAWRRELILEAGGFASNTLAEDTDLTLAILRRGYKIKYEEEAVGLTEAPDTMGALLRQRSRWMYGTLQAAWKHLDTLCRPRYGVFGMLAIPNILVFQILSPLIAPLMDLFTVGSVAVVVWQRYHHPAADYSIEALKRTLFFYLLFVAADFLGSFLAFLFERKEDWKLLGSLPIQRFVYRQLLYYVAIRAVITAIRGKLVGWHKVERKATVLSELSQV